ncbi:MAG: hypothetical protein IT307_00850 [Chloroflexi bacterium]|nr:hypothetical protein [Chloroflexota bacterium]
MLQCTAAVVEAGGQPGAITIEHARWVAQLARVCPGMPAWLTFWQADKRLRREQAGQPTADLDTFLALTPWRSPEAAARFAVALAASRENLPDDRRKPLSGVLLDSLRVLEWQTGRPVAESLADLRAGRPLATERGADHGR